MSIITWILAIIAVVAMVTFIVKSQTTVTPAPSNLGEGGGDSGKGVYTDPNETPTKSKRQPKL